MQSTLTVQKFGQVLWQRYGFEHSIRDEMELALTIRYVIANPVRAGLVIHPFEYPYLGSCKYSVEQLLRSASTRGLASKVERFTHPSG